jgi:hypothetical protein
MERRRLVIIKTDELLRLSHSAQLVTLVKEKLCDLAVMGTLA